MDSTRSASSSPLSSIPDEDSIFSLSLSPSPIARRSERRSSSTRNTRSSASSAAVTGAAKTSVTVTTVEIEEVPSPPPSPSPSPSPSSPPLKSPEKPSRVRKPAATRKKLSKKPPKGKAKAKKPSKWDAESIITDPLSPLATANLRSILSNPIAWTILTKDEQSEILALFPDQQHILDPGTGDARPNFASLLNDDSFRYDCAAYTANLAHGRHDPEWLAQAWAAHERRKAGDYEDYLMHKLQSDWGVDEVPTDEEKKDEMDESPRGEVMTMTTEVSAEEAAPGDLHIGASSDMKMDVDDVAGGND